MADRADPVQRILRIRTRHPEAIREAALRRRRRPLLSDSDRLVIIAADHPARGALRAGADALAMGHRADLLDRLVVALSRPGVDGVLGTADIVEDLLLLGALDEKVVLGSMNRGGLAGTVFEIDDRFTGYDADGIAEGGLDGGKMLLRIDPGDPATAHTLESCARAVDALAERRLMALVEPFISRRIDGRVRNDVSPDAVIRSLTVASGLGRTSAYTWLKVPVVEDMERVMSAATLPALLLGGEVAHDAERAESAYERMEKALHLPTVRGVVAGRSLLYPLDGDVAGAVDRVASMVDKARPGTIHETPAGTS